jgi:hypothetical protein
MRLGSRILLSSLSFLLAAECAFAQAATPAPAAEADAQAAPEAEDESPAAQRPIQIPQLPTDERSTAQIAYILRRRGSEFRIPDMEIYESTVPVVLISKGTEIKPTIAIHGQFSRPGWKLMLQDQIPVTFSGASQPGQPSTEFTIYAHLNGRVSEISVSAVGPGGQRQLEKVYIYAPNARAFHVVSAWDDLLLSAGLTNMSYEQTGFGAYQSINALISARYSNADGEPRFGILGSAEMTVLAFASSPISTSPQLLEGKIDLSIRPSSQPLTRFRTRLLLGFTYLTMFSNGSPFGFSDLAAPEAGLQFRYIATYREDYVAELHFAPIGGLTKIDQHGLNMSFGWSKLLQDSRRLEVGLSYSAYSYQPDNTVSILTSLVSLKAGLTL